ncbi:MAG: glycosyl transferase family 2 [Elusimicrobia bacterium RIFOXYB2_FULL_49_7]|nr:MAG: glycosyl transferase family 2 [Elusimicrobia bacterium RIFOXYB2_FULL_49_7]
MKVLSIVIPVYNSETCVDALCDRLEKVLAGFAYEIILINDHSPDGSWQKICTVAQQNPNIVGVNLRKNVGQDNAIMAGLRLSQGEFVIIMDDDLQHSPEDIPKLLEACRATGADVVYAHFGHQQHARWKRLGSALNGWVAEKLIYKPKGVYLSPFKIIRREVVLEMVKYEGPWPYVQGLLLSVTSSIAEVDVEHKPRHAGRSNFNFIRSASVFLKLVTSFSVIPLRIASFLGMGAALTGFLLAGYYVYEYFALDSTVEGWTSLVLLVLVLGGLILMSLGLIGEYLGRLVLSVNRRPQYVIKEVIGRSTVS